MSSPEKLPTKDELQDLSQVLGESFIQRWDMYARQRDDGAYLTVHRRLQADHLIDHLRGDRTLGAYVLDEASQGRYLVLDADNSPDWRRLQGLGQVLSQMDCPSYLEDSRRGGHLWLFLEETLPGEEIRRFGQGLLAHFGIMDVELFPKQDRLSSGPGSLIRLPFGVHRKSDRRYGFYTPDGQPLAPTLRGQIRALATPGTVPENVFSRFKDLELNTAPKNRFQQQRSRERGSEIAPDAPLSSRIKAAISVRQFLLQYVELSPAGRGLCPFHDDTQASFSVNDDEAYWHCFACDEGGSIIDFWMLYRDCDFKTAVGDLARSLLTEENPAPMSEETTVIFSEDTEAAGIAT